MLNYKRLGLISTANDIKNTKPFQYLSYFIKHAVKRSALIETIFFLVAIILVSNFIGDGTRFINVSPHPFWIIVLLITLQYGANEAIAAAILASIFLLVGNLPEQSLTETMYSYILRLLSLPFLWIVTALVLGGIRTRQLNERNNMREKLKRTRRAVETITEGYNAVKQSKEQLEMRLAAEKCSILTVYEVAKSLETTDPSEAPAAIERLVNIALNPIKFSIFLVKDNCLQLDTSHGWKKTDSYITKFANKTPLAQAILYNKNAALSIVNHADEAPLMGQGIMAGAISDKRSGKIFGMLKIEEMNFNDFGARTHETFLLVCEWIAYVYANTEKYKAANVTNILANSNKLDLKDPANISKISQANAAKHNDTPPRRALYAK